MTLHPRYHAFMNILSVSVQAQGIIWTALLFVLCAIIVHGVKLSLIGYRAMGKKPEPPQPAKEPEPVYYIVEKKKKRSKTEYAEPREVSFK